MGRSWRSWSWLVVALPLLAGCPKRSSSSRGAKAGSGSTKATPHVPPPAWPLRVSYTRVGPLDSKTPFVRDSIAARFGGSQLRAASATAGKSRAKQTRFEVVHGATVMLRLSGQGRRLRHVDVLSARVTYGRRIAVGATRAVVAREVGALDCDAKPSGALSWCRPRGRKLSFAFARGRLVRIRWYPWDLAVHDEHPLSAEPCRVDTSACQEDLTGNPTTTKLANRAFERLKEGAVPEAVCAAATAARRALAEKRPVLAGAAYYTLGRALRKLRCSFEAQRAYRRSLCVRPAGKTSAKIIKLVEAACSRAEADCASPCRQLPDALPSAPRIDLGDEGVKPEIAVRVGQTVPEAKRDWLCKRSSEDGSLQCDEPAIKRVRSDKHEIVVMLMQSTSREGAGLVWLRRLARRYKVIGVYLERGSNGAGKSTQATFKVTSDEVALTTKSCNADLDYDGDGVRDEGHCDKATTTLGFDAKRVWLSSREVLCKRTGPCDD
ncbi:MAG: hypothetical protein KC503_28290 [Myxococcales bacterium]|nr:hypothetical protein [Myxococcales bacterium]